VDEILACPLHQRREGPISEYRPVINTVASLREAVSKALIELSNN
jgi:hypothetical protein